MSNFIFANDVNTSLAGPVSSSATSLTLASTHGLPSSIPSGQVLVITLRDQATRQNSEIIYASAISGATLSGLSRGQEGTSALAWLTGDYAYSGPTAGQMGSFMQVQNFPSSLGTSGYKKYPDPNSPSGYYIEQWGQISVSPNSTVNVVLPIPFPTAFMQPICSLGSAIAPGFTYAVGIDPIGLNEVSITLITTTSSSLGVHWRAIGY